MFLLGSLAAGMAVGRLARHVDVSEVGQAAKDALQPDSSSGSGSGGEGPSGGTGPGGTPASGLS
jgi:hypothetical protein